jgi:hypothetical protein
VAFSLRERHFGTTGERILRQHNQVGQSDQEATTAAYHSAFPDIEIR